eukprot:PLAT3484.2.p1 GENE.PLAT3484.2~~PLAT3484.2.p1  ORF type:complete len:172 (-),score=29.00 PLAT3484.2:65-580(-)
MLALNAFRQGRVKGIICTGGLVPHRGLTYVEADESKRWLLQQLAVGEEEPPILLERLSRSTAENALFALPLMEEAGWRSAYVVTNHFHSWRALQTFRNMFRYGTEQRGLPASAAPSASCLRMRDHTPRKQYGREILALALNVAQGSVPLRSLPPLIEWNWASLRALLASLL